MSWRGRIKSSSNRSTLLTAKDMKKKIAVLTLCVMVLALCVSTHAQQPGKIFRIGFLDSSSAAASATLVDAFRQELSRLGWIEGKNIAIDFRYGQGKLDRYPELAGEMVRLKVDLIVVEGTGLAVAAKRATTTIPIVVTNAGGLVGLGLVDSLARPGGNVTGNESLTPELNTKRLEILKDTVPKLIRVGLLFSAGGASAEFQLKELRPAALALKLKLEEIETQAVAESLASAFQTAKEKQVGAIMMQSTRPLLMERKRIVELAGKYRLAAIYPQKGYVEAGGLMSYGTDQTDNYRRAAIYVDKILKGAKPADLPVQQATKFEFIINLKAAKQIGLTIPPRVLERANQVIK
jgi:putative tryptophan/tyrosine transport system substrate-binding protein